MKAMQPTEVSYKRLYSTIFFLFRSQLSWQSTKCLLIPIKRLSQGEKGWLLEQDIIVQLQTAWNGTEKCFILKEDAAIKNERDAFGVIEAVKKPKQQRSCQRQGDCRRYY